MKQLRFFSLFSLFSLLSVTVLMVRAEAVKNDCCSAVEARITKLEARFLDIEAQLPRVVDAQSMMLDIQEEGNKVQQTVVGKYESKMRSGSEELQGLQEKLKDAKDDAKKDIQKDIEEKRKKLMDLQKAAEAEMKKESERLEKKAAERIDTIKEAAKEEGASTIADKGMFISYNDSFSKKVKARVDSKKSKSVKKDSDEKKEDKSSEKDSEIVAKASGDKKKIVAYKK